MALVTIACLFRRLKFNLPILSSNGLKSTFGTSQFKTISALRSVQSQNNFFNVSAKGIGRLKIRDNIPDNYTLIYKAPMETLLRAVYPVITISTIVASSYVLVRYWGETQIGFNQSKHNVHFLNPSSEIWIFLGGMVMFALLGVSLIFKFPFRVYKHNSKKEYIALFLSSIPWKLSQFHFQKATLTKFKNPLYFFMNNNCHYFIDNKKAFLLAHYFRKPVDLCEMEGSK